MILSDAAYDNTAEFGCLCYYWLPPVSPKGYQQLFMEFSTASRGIIVGLDEHRRAFRVLSEAIPPDAKPIPVLEQLVPTVTDYIAAETKQDVGTDARSASPKDVSNQQDIRISYYNVQTSTPGTPTNHTAEAKQSMSRHLQLVATDEELREQTHIVVDADENFPPVYLTFPKLSTLQMKMIS